MVFDEIDAICRPRGMGGDQAVGMVYDGLVNQARATYCLALTIHYSLLITDSLLTTND